MTCESQAVQALEEVAAVVAPSTYRFVPDIELANVGGGYGILDY